MTLSLALLAAFVVWVGAIDSNVTDGASSCITPSVFTADPFASTTIIHGGATITVGPGLTFTVPCGTDSTGGGSTLR